MTAFLVAAAALLVAAAPCLKVLFQGGAMEAVVGYEVFSSAAVMALALMAQGFSRSGLFELPVMLALLLYGSGLVFVRMLERWL